MRVVTTTVSNHEPVAGQSKRRSDLNKDCSNQVALDSGASERLRLSLLSSSANPYAQLCYDPHLNMMKVLYVGSSDTKSPLKPFQACSRCILPLNFSSSHSDASSSIVSDGGWSTGTSSSGYLSLSVHSETWLDAAGSSEQSLLMQETEKAAGRCGESLVRRFRRRRIYPAAALSRRSSKDASRWEPRTFVPLNE
jgi:hypothetical protein